MTTLRDVNNLAFMHRDRVRFRAGTSALLGVVLEPSDHDGFVTNVSRLAELHRIDVAANGSAAIGAFATLDALTAALPSAFPPGVSPSNARMRLALYDARVTVYGLGRTRVAPVDALALKPFELPVTIDVPPVRAGLGIAERRRITSDGEMSFTLGVTVALRISMLARFEGVRIFLDIDDEVRRAPEAEAKLERQGADRDLFADTARFAAASLPATDARSSAMARALPPLVVAALREAFDAARKR